MRTLNRVCVHEPIVAVDISQKSISVPETRVSKLEGREGSHQERELVQLPYPYPTRRGGSRLVSLVRACMHEKVLVEARSECQSFLLYIKLPSSPSMALPRRPHLQKCPPERRHPRSDIG